MASVPLVAYLARYPATMASVMGLLPRMVMTRTSTWSPHSMSHPSGWVGWGGVVNRMAWAA